MLSQAKIRMGKSFFAPDTFRIVIKTGSNI